MLGRDFEVLHAALCVEGDALVAAEDDYGGAFGGLAHEEDGDGGEGVDEVDLGEVDFATPEVFFAADVAEGPYAG